MLVVGGRCWWLLGWCPRPEGVGGSLVFWVLKDTGFKTVRIFFATCCFVCEAGLLFWQDLKATLAS